MCGIVERAQDCASTRRFDDRVVVNHHLTSHHCEEDSGLHDFGMPGDVLIFIRFARFKLLLECARS